MPLSFTTVGDHGSPKPEEIVGCFEYCRVGRVLPPADAVNAILGEAKLSIVQLEQCLGALADGLRVLEERAERHSGRAAEMMMLDACTYQTVIGCVRGMLAELAAREYVQTSDAPEQVAL